MASWELLQQVPSVFKADAAPSLHCVIQFVTDTPAYLSIDGRTCTVSAGIAPAADLTVTLSDHNLCELLRGKLNPVMGLMLRKLQAEGDLELGSRLTSLFDFSKLNALSPR